MPETHRRNTTLLMEHAATGKSGPIREMKATLPDINAQDSAGWSALMWACGRHEREHYDLEVQSFQYFVVKVLLYRGADLNLADRDGRTPLMQVAHRGWWQLLPLLIEHGANPSLRSKCGETALSLAKAAGHTNIVEVLEPAISHFNKTALETIAQRNEHVIRPGPKPKPNM